MLKGTALDALRFLSALGPEWAIPIAICPLIYTAFAFTEGVASPVAKEFLSTYIKNGVYESFLGDLPKNVESLFIRVFGENHLSRKCILQSLKLSIISTTLATLIVVVPNRHIFHYITLLSPKIDEYLRNTPPKTVEMKRSYEIIHDVLHSKSWLVFAPILWVGWSLVPDYLSLLKTRIVLVVLEHTNVSQSTILFVTAIDFLLGLLVFFASFAFFQLLYLNIIFLVDGQPLMGSFGLYLVFFWVIFSVEFLYLTLTGAVFLFLPISSLFWASLVPSLWMWAYLGAATIARASFKYRRLRLAVVYFLDFDNKPIKALGVIASFVNGTVFFVCIAIYTIL